MNRWQREALEAVLGRKSEGFSFEPKPFRIQSFQDEKAANALAKLFPESLEISFIKGKGHFLVTKFGIGLLI